MKTLVLTTILIASSWPAAAQSCSVAPRPMKPINPLGCSDTRATCVCEPNGNCHWIWACVPVGGTVNSHTDSGIDPSIPLRVRPPQAPDLMDSYRKALEIRSLQQQQSVQPQAEPQAALPTRVASPADSQLTETSWKTVGLANGRAWILFSADEKNIFIIGACDTMLGISPKDYHIYFPKLLKTGEFSNALDRFYEDAENIPIPILWAMGLVTMKANGATPSAFGDALALTKKNMLAPSSDEAK